jgi:PAS domain S-box-containing protein
MSSNASAAANPDGGPGNTIREMPPGLGGSPDILIRTKAGHITTWSPGMQRRYGFTSEQAQGHISRQLLETRFPRKLADIEAILQEHNTWRGVTLHRHADGGPVTAVNHWHLHRDDYGHSPLVTEVHSDIAQEGSAISLDVADVLAALTQELRATLAAISLCVEGAHRSLQAGWPDLNSVRDAMTRASSQLVRGEKDVGLLGELANLMR